MTGETRTEPNPGFEPEPPPRQFQADLLTELFSDPLDPGYADAAKARAERGPVQGWRRWVPRGTSMIALLVIGVLFSVAYQQVVARTPEREKARADLIEEITERKQQSDELTSSAERLQDEVTLLREAALSDTAISALRELEAATGMRKVTGDGIVVRLSDGPNGLADDAARIIDNDLQRVANALWAADAEAVAINGQRLTSTTPIRRAGEAILVGSTWVLSPYEVSAIGPSSLADNFNDSVTAALLRALHDDIRYQVGFEVKERSDLVLPAAVLPQLRDAAPPSASPSPSISPARTVSLAPTASPSGGRK